MPTNNQPLVSIICTCYNHERFVGESIRSALNQTYPSIEIIIIDDNSTDFSVLKINEEIEGEGQVKFIRNSENQGICKNFNHGFRLSKGKYLIDLSGDDVLMHDCVEKQVRLFELLPEDFGVVFTNARLISENGHSEGHFYKVDQNGKALNTPLDGDIYLDLIRKYFIAAPTMMMRRSMLEDLNGYDEAMAYEDFDFWIRSSRDWKYKYLDEALIKIRNTDNSLSSKQYQLADLQLNSTYRVCEKIKTLNRNKEEDDALIKRIKYELKHAVFADKQREADLFISFLSQLQPPSTMVKFLKGLNRSRLKTGWLRDYLIRLKS